MTSANDFNFVRKFGRRTWLISDTHFGHNNILKYAARPHDHETLMLYYWTEIIGENDQIIHLGDVLFSAPKKWKTLIRNLPGEKFLIKGNHDTRTNHFYEDCGFTIIREFAVEVDYQKVAITHRPISDSWNAVGDDWDINIHGHIHNNGYRREYDGELFPNRKYINISVEETAYMPVRLGDLLGY